MDAQSNASEAALDQARRKRSRLVQTIDPAFPGVRGLRDLWQGWRDYRELWLTVGLFKPRLASARCSRKRSSGSRSALAEPSFESLSTMIASNSARLCTASASMQFCNS